MASPQILSLQSTMAAASLDLVSSTATTSTASIGQPSKKQEHLVAGRRKLEQYRKKKAQEKKAEEKNPGGKNKKDGAISESTLSTLPTTERILQSSGASSLASFDEPTHSSSESYKFEGEQVFKSLSLGNVLTDASINGVSSERHRRPDFEASREKGEKELWGGEAFKDSEVLSDELASSKLKAQGNSSGPISSKFQNLNDVSMFAPSIESKSLPARIDGVVADYSTSSSVDGLLGADGPHKEEDALSSLRNPGVQDSIPPFWESSSARTNGNIRSGPLDNLVRGFSSSHSLDQLAEDNLINIDERVYAGRDASHSSWFKDGGGFSTQDERADVPFSSEAANSITANHADFLNGHQLGLAFDKERDYLFSTTASLAFAKDPVKRTTEIPKSKILEDNFDLKPPSFEAGIHFGGNNDFNLLGSSGSKQLPESSPLPQFSSVPLEDMKSSFSLPPFRNPSFLSISTRDAIPSSSFPLSTVFSTSSSLPDRGGIDARSKGGAAPLQSSHPYSSYEASDVGSATSEEVKPVEWSMQLQQSSERDEFSALEQHIQDLTQEKFSLQRALDAARSLAESLAQENSSLTDDFNQQGSVVYQLKLDLEKQKEEVQAQALVLNNLMAERERAQQESNSALERSQLLAAEVIGLEEKVLKLRSNELKLERDLEAIKVENDSCKRHIATLDKDRTNLRSMVDALQEEKKLLQERMRKGAVGGAHENAQISSKEVQHSKEQRDASTCTDDLDIQESSIPNQEASSSTSSSEIPQMEGREGNDIIDFFEGGRGDKKSSIYPASPLLHDRTSVQLSAASFSLPPDQLRTLENINLLISEFANEKDSLIKAVNRESIEAAKLRALSSELSEKLEVQTQRLELAIAQNIAHGGGMLVNSQEEPPNEVDYVDEGDEVVERVLGWIMKLFPAGSSKRRSSKLL